MASVVQKLRPFYHVYARPNLSYHDLLLEQDHQRVMVQNIYFYFSKQYNSTGEIIMMHVAHRAVMVY